MSVCYLLTAPPAHQLFSNIIDLLFAAEQMRTVGLQSCSPWKPLMMKRAELKKRLNKIGDDCLGVPAFCRLRQRTGPRHYFALKHVQTTVCTNK